MSQQPIEKQATLATGQQMANAPAPPAPPAPAAHVPLVQRVATLEAAIAALDKTIRTELGA